MALSENKISSQDLQVIQNIQDVCHNCTKLKIAQDSLLKTTTCPKYDLDNKVKTKNNEPTTSFDQILICYSNKIIMELEKSPD